MAVTIDATAGGASSNSFVTLVEAQAYMDGRLNASAWSGASPADQNIALIEATRELNSRTWAGTRTTSTQALQWPRSWVEDPDAPLGGVVYYNQSVIPQRIKDATCELAFQFLNYGTTDLAASDPTLNVKSKSIGSGAVATEYFEPAVRLKGLARFPRVARLIAPLLEESGMFGRVVRG
jgi:hypothetical protein